MLPIRLFGGKRPVSSMAWASSAGFCHSSYIVSGSCRHRHADGGLRILAIQVPSPAYRDHGQCWPERLGSPRRHWRELTGRRDGYSHGQLAAPCTCSPRKRISTCGHGIVGGQDVAWHGPPGFAQQVIAGNDNVISSPISATAPPTRARSTRASTWAALWKLPVIYIIREQPATSMGTSTRALLGPKSELLAGAATPSAIPVPPGRRQWMLPRGPTRAARRGRRQNERRYGKGPFMPRNASAYRYRGHSMSGPGEVSRPRTKCRRCAPEHDPIEQVQGPASSSQARVPKMTSSPSTRRCATWWPMRPTSPRTTSEPDASELYTDILL